MGKFKWGLKLGIIKLDFKPVFLVGDSTRGICMGILPVSFKWIF